MFREGEVKTQHRAQHTSREGKKRKKKPGGGGTDDPLTSTTSHLAMAAVSSFLWLRVIVLLATQAAFRQAGHKS